MPFDDFVAAMQTLPEPYKGKTLAELGDRREHLVRVFESAPEKDAVFYVWRTVVVPNTVGMHSQRRVDKYLDNVIVASSNPYQTPGVESFVAPEPLDSFESAVKKNRFEKTRRMLLTVAVAASLYALTQFNSIKDLRGAATYE